MYKTFCKLRRPKTTNNPFPLIYILISLNKNLTRPLYEVTRIVSGWWDTHTNQSMAQRRETSATGASMAVRTIIMRTRAAEGTEAEAMEAAVAVSLDRQGLAFGWRM